MSGDAPRGGSPGAASQTHLSWVSGKRSSSPAMMLAKSTHTKSGELSRMARNSAPPAKTYGRASVQSVYSPRIPKRRASNSGGESKYEDCVMCISSDIFKAVQAEAISPPQGLVKPTFKPHPAAKDNNDDAVARAANSWRRMLVSPLLGFLTDIRNGEWVQLAGHMDSFLPGRAGTICKKSCDMEKEAYEGLCVVAEPLREFTPLYFSEVEMVEGEHYLELQDLLAEFKNPCVMDVKMGVRTFLESEVAKKTTRMDLLGKMMKLDPDEPSEDEKANGITKLRYMEFREKLSSSRNLGFRIEGIKLGEDPPINTFKTKKERDEVAEVITTEFLPSSAPMRRKIVQTMHGRLLDLKDALGESKFFYTHELVGSSLLFVYDERGEAGIWMIDFGKTKKVDVDVTHDQPWVVGNHEDGYLIGLEGLIEIIGSSL